MKKILLVIVTIGLFITGCTNKNALVFKNDYEALNGKENSSGKVHRTLNIPEDNPYEKVSSDKILELIDSKETFYVYFGDEMCPWCRSVIEKSIEVAKNNNIRKIYYVKIWDSEGNEILRSKYKLNDSNEPELVQKGTENYYKLLEKFDKVLADFTLSTKTGEKINVGEKRIYAPNFIYVEKGIPKKLVEGISDKQKDSREELTIEILKDEENLFDKFFKK